MPIRTFSRFWAICVLSIFAPIFAFGGNPAYPSSGQVSGQVSGQAANGTLRVIITDKGTGRVVPALVCITSAADGSWRVPPDGTIASPHPVTGNQQIAGWAAGPGLKEWKPGDPGPVRLTENVPLPGVPDSERQGVYRVYQGLPAMPYWDEPVGYFVAEPFTITLPPGKWRLAVSRGPEYLPVFEEISLAPRQHTERQVKLQRWVDMRKLGWYSGDPEFHDWRDKPWRNRFILAWAEAQDVHMISDPSFNKNPNVIGHPQLGYGKKFWYQVGDYAIASAHEGPRTDACQQGHLMQLNISSVVIFPTEYHLMGKVCDGVHAQGGLCGYNHLAYTPEFCRSAHRTEYVDPGWDKDINIIRRKIDFIEILQFRQLGVSDYYDSLNMGVKLTALAGSDVTGGEMLGESRTYAYTDHNFTPGTWYEAVKEGHTFVTNGPMLTLTVNGKIPGDVLQLGKSRKVHIHARAWAPEPIGAPTVLEIISQGRVIHSVQPKEPQQSELTADFDLPVSESQWIVARTTTFNKGYAHTSAVYLVVDGASFANRKQLPQLISNKMEMLDRIEQLLHDPNYIQRNGYTAGELPTLLANIEDARAKYKEVLAEGGLPPNPSQGLRP